MFPYSNYSTPLIAFEPVSSQLYPNSDFGASFGPVGNYYYFSQPTYYEANFNFGQFLAPTQLKDDYTRDFKLFRAEDLQKVELLSMDKINSSSTTDQKTIYETQPKLKTKLINKNGRQLQRLSCEGSSKQKKQTTSSKYNQQEYSAEQYNKKKSDEQLHLYLKYRRKNTESNIVNRIYSFLTSEFKNKQEFFKLKLTEQQKETYLKYLLLVVEAWKGPVKRQLLYGLTKVNESLPAYKVLQKLHQTEKCLSIEQFQYLNRTLIRTYLSKIATVSVITSKKMKKNVWKEHLQKIRELNQYFFQSDQSRP